MITAGGTHDSKVDIWSLGCMTYVSAMDVRVLMWSCQELLVGKPPFETKSLAETQTRIRAGALNFPPFTAPGIVFPPLAQTLIKKVGEFVVNLDDDDVADGACRAERATDGRTGDERRVDRRARRPERVDLRFDRFVHSHYSPPTPSHSPSTFTSA